MQMSEAILFHCHSFRKNQFHQFLGITVILFKDSLQNLFKRNLTSRPIAKSLHPDFLEIFNRHTCIHGHFFSKVDGAFVMCDQCFVHIKNNCFYHLSCPSNHALLFCYFPASIFSSVSLRISSRSSVIYSEKVTLSLA